MAKMSHEKIAAEVAALGYELIDDSKYTNLLTPILIKCKEDHYIEASLSDIRKPSFTCPCCDKSITFVNPNSVPDKGNSRRIIAFDQATEKFGLSIFDDGKLVFYHLYVFSGDLNARLIKIRKFIQEIVITQWKPDFIVMEDIQYQNGLITFKILAMLLGIVEEVCGENNIPYEVVSPNVWRKYAGTCGKSRKEEKLLSIALVKEKYDITVTDDVAEAILIGNYAVKTQNKTKITTAFGKKK